MRRGLNNVISRIWHVIMAGIIIIIMFAGKIPYVSFHKRPFLLPNIIFFIIGALLLAIINKVFSEERTRRINVIVLYAAMLILPIFVAMGAMFITGWDAGGIFMDSIAVARGESITYDYSSNPNNMLLFVLASAIVKMAMKIGFTDIHFLYGSCVALQCILFGITGWLVYDYLHVLRGKRIAVIGAFIYLIFIGVSPFVYIVYTDAMGLIFPVLMLWLSKRMPEDKTYKVFVKWLLILMVGILGYYMKAPVFIMFIALFISFCINSICLHTGKKLALDIIIVLMVIGLGVFFKTAGMNIITTAFEYTSGTTYDTERAKSIYHFLMIGLNKDNDGTTNPEDEAFSFEINNRSERITQEKKRCKQRIADLGISGFGNLYIHKIALNFNDGSFGYAISGMDYIEQKFDDGEQLFGNIVKKIYWPGRGRFFIWINYAQMLWLGILAFALRYKVENENDYPAVIALVGAILFTMIFEAQARYLFIWSPVFVVLAASSMSRKSMN
ncbi:glycosyltransferase family 39 protein [Butyrivibrio proteoclasticus]|uniref:glycosyltransferase family 39 protein n=1 Tax=Butyrivibrio proteoclasticus TaxID=43305 RepID=UPI00047BE51B|nr:glycosyltransferase family 39 protein [Butyrivibrio proteoclasticus]